jgi:hypothetical protein
MRQEVTTTTVTKGEGKEKGKEIKRVKEDVDVRLLRACNALPVLERLAARLDAGLEAVRERREEVAEVESEVAFDRDFLNGRRRLRVAAWNRLRAALSDELGCIESRIEGLQRELAGLQRLHTERSHYLDVRCAEHEGAQSVWIAAVRAAKLRLGEAQQGSTFVEAEARAMRKPVFKELGILLKRLRRKGALSYLRVIFNNEISAHPDYVARVERLKKALIAIVRDVTPEESKRVAGIIDLLSSQWTKSLAAGLGIDHHG